jgi:DNA-binding HxlR family transcriptional regulator
MVPIGRYPGLEGVEYCPVSIGAKLIADRWSLLIVRELLQGASRFNEIHRGLPGLSRSLLSSRLRSLIRQGLLRNDNTSGTYHLTPAGEDLRDVLLALGIWTVRWRFPPPSSSEADSALLLWRMFQSLRLDQLPKRRVTVELAFEDATPDRGWLVLAGADSSLCMEPPGGDIDVVVTGSVKAWLSIWFGHRSYADAVRTGALRLLGPPRLTDELPRWFEISPFATLIDKVPIDPNHDISAASS